MKLKFLPENMIYNIIEYIDSFNDFKNIKLLNKFYNKLCIDFGKYVKNQMMKCILKELCYVLNHVETVIKMSDIKIFNCMLIINFIQDQFMFYAINGDVLIIVC